MKHLHYSEVEAFDALALGLEGASKMTIKLLSDDSVWIELQPQGHTPGHTHGDKERMVVMAGEGELKVREERKRIKAGDFIEIGADESHQVTNDTRDLLSLICFRNQK